MPDSFLGLAQNHLDMAQDHNLPHYVLADLVKEFRQLEASSQFHGFASAKETWNWVRPRLVKFLYDYTVPEQNYGHGYTLQKFVEETRNIEFFNNEAALTEPVGGPPGSSRTFDKNDPSAEVRNYHNINVDSATLAPPHKHYQAPSGREDKPRGRPVVDNNKVQTYSSVVKGGTSKTRKGTAPSVASHDVTRNGSGTSDKEARKRDESDDERAAGHLSVRVKPPGKRPCNERPQLPHRKTSMTSSRSSGKHVKCPDCDKLFENNSRLRSHLPVHSNERYQCPVCFATLKQRKQLPRHLKNVCNQTDAEIEGHMSEIPDQNMLGRLGDRISNQSDGIQDEFASHGSTFSTDALMKNTTITSSQTSYGEPSTSNNNCRPHGFVVQDPVSQETRPRIAQQEQPHSTRHPGTWVYPSTPNNLVVSGRTYADVLQDRGAQHNIPIDPVLLAGESDEMLQCFSPDIQPHVKEIWETTAQNQEM